MDDVVDNYDLWLAHEAEKEKALAELPCCEYCGNPIQDEHYYEIDGDIICEKCLNYHFRKDATL